MGKVTSCGLPQRYLHSPRRVGLQVVLRLAKLPDCAAGLLKGRVLRTLRGAQCPYPFSLSQDGAKGYGTFILLCPASRADRYWRSRNRAEVGTKHIPRMWKGREK